MPPHAAVAQLAEQRIRNAQVAGSNPAGSSIFFENEKKEKIMNNDNMQEEKRHVRYPRNPHYAAPAGA